MPITNLLPLILGLVILRDVNKMVEKINQGISKIGKQNVEMHFYNVLKNSNQTDVDQNTPEWHNLRQKIITGSCWPYLVGLHGPDKSDRYWQLIHFGLDQKCLFPSQFKNLERGHRFESEAISYFENASGCKTQHCGFYKLAEDPHYGSSPDALYPGLILLEVKTRAENCSSPLDNLVGKRHYVLQPNLQMICTGETHCILESYHPDSKSANFYLLKKDNLLCSVSKDLTDSILSNSLTCDRPHHEEKQCPNRLKRFLVQFLLLKIPEG